MDDKGTDLSIDRLGSCRIPSPMKGVRFVDDDEGVVLESRRRLLLRELEGQRELRAFELAGPRRELYFDPSKLKCGIVTCGGLCPGLNDVVRSIVMSLHHHYGVDQVSGFRFGYEGLAPDFGHPVMDLTPKAVNHIHKMGGTVLGSSRGAQDVAVMVDTLERMGIGILFTIGGDGTLRGARAMSEEIARRGLKIAVIGIPKTIDNDISFIRQSFGFETAVTEATRASRAAHSEAVGARNGIGLVKLMGRDSGFIAAFTALADSQVNYCLIPESPFTVEGLCSSLEARLERKGHAVILVAEGAGQDLLAASGELDASGNVKYGDIGIFVRDAIKAHFAKRETEINLKYIDPSYLIRSLPANARDAAFCQLLGHNAVHAGMSGRTDTVVGFWSHQFTHVPIPLAVSKRKQVDPASILWSSVLASTGQPADLC